MKSFAKVAPLALGLGVLIVGGGFGLAKILATHYVGEGASVVVPVLDQNDYNARLLALAHISPLSVMATTATSTGLASTTPRIFSTATTSVMVEGARWPVPTVYPKAGALLPFKRIVAYYGNFYSKGMGVLGEYPADVVLAKLASTTELWAAADPNTPVVPAIHYIAVVAQAGPGKEGKYILRMPDAEIEHALELAQRVNGIVILDVQVGKSTLEYELPFLEKYLVLPTVHLAIDPEFSMKFGDAPGTVIGTMNEKDVNFAANYLATLVRTHGLPPKVLIVHRFTKDMVKGYSHIMPLPEVQMVIDMDGFGSKALKYGTYNHVVAPEPVQFTGIKLFYKNDNRPPADGMLSPEEVLQLTPAPVYIQYQ